MLLLVHNQEVDRYKQYQEVHIDIAKSLKRSYIHMQTITEILPCNSLIGLKLNCNFHNCLIHTSELETLYAQLATK